ncbi:hypothetical protein SPRG_09716 [Saprolegnia parasitica CBS 223.65]|uniref:Uncharacterized protein n=1 Tax=Saprolegnia parasitica (strain CBS 223.65) TaxID=695850 RepID=A0A067CEK3_SAPPC|nr:hypothetical protein SPRG_09716 [Saprolegnia parasitica CBS 223.65]KDO24986.1 hypothetical protein SPRG_09716 [Saprolegnia parasitica CBS 223.65]|eukprot:XP_012204255.1 hypothetical protein SPRG_09716 [Saprolegnia parasitica CBS 223.65]
MTKRGCQRATSSSSLPGFVLHGLLHMLDDDSDVLNLLDALPLVALRDLGAVVDLDEHWPVVNVTKIPIQHAHLAIAALPAFTGVHVDSGVASLAWLDATPKAPVTLVADASVPGALSAFAYVCDQFVQVEELLRVHQRYEVSSGVFKAPSPVTPRRHY